MAAAVVANTAATAAATKLKSISGARLGFNRPRFFLFSACAPDGLQGKDNFLNVTNRKTV